MTSRLSRQLPRLPRRGLYAVVLVACCHLCCAQLLGSTSSQVLALSGAALASYISQPAVCIITLRGIAFNGRLALLSHTVRAAAHEEGPALCRSRYAVEW